MKSYFAKLAARATPATLSASSPRSVAKMADPFAEHAMPTSESTSLPTREASLSADVTSNAQTSPSTKTIEADLPTAKYREVELRASDQAYLRPANPISETHQTDLPIERATQRKLKQPSSEVDGLPSADESVRQLEPPAMAKAMSTVEVSSVNTGQRMRESIDLNADEPSLAKVDDSESQHDTSFLLSKADDFMERLFTRHEKSVEYDADVETEQPSEQLTKVEAPTRLQPMPAVSRAAETIAEPPGLVIGTLTVEVMPPHPAPVAPVQRVVVVRGTSGARTALPSSRRFGLSQF